MITRKYLESRILELTAARDKHQADVNANNGAIQFCQHLLGNLAAEAEAEQAKSENAEHGEEPKANGETSEALPPEGIDP
jgi:hypothetical protein